jgi:hypothetical protein
MQITILILRHGSAKLAQQERSSIKPINNVKLALNIVPHAILIKLQKR